jgi:hypothetical protein
MMNILRAHPSPVTAIVEGLAASAASFLIAGGADQVIMRPGAELMVHKPWAALEGDGPTFVKAAGDLERLGATIADIYAGKAGGTRAKWTGLMDAETWFTADEAVAAGLADKVTDPRTTSAVATTRTPIMAHYKYRSRAEAPTPNLKEEPVDPEQTTTPTDTPQLTEEQWTTLTDLLGLTPEATADDVLKAVEDLTADQAGDTPTNRAVRNSTRRNRGAAPTIIDSETWAQMQTTLKVGLRAQNQEKRVAAEQVVDQAIRYGKAQARQREDLIQAYNLDPEETMRRLRKGKEVPFFEIGHAHNPDGPSTPTGWVR